MSGFWILMHAHDRVWNDRTIPLAIRMKASQILWELALAVAKEQAGCSSASIVERSERLTEAIVGGAKAGL